MSDIDVARQSTKGTVSLFIGNLVATVIAAVAIIVIARLLGPEGYGIYTLALLTPNIVQTAVGLGLGTAITRYAAYHRSRGEMDVAKRMTMNGLSFLFVFGAAMSLLTFFEASALSTLILHRPALEGLTKLAAAVVFGQTVLQTVASALTGWSSMGMVGLTSVAQAVIRLAVAPTLILLGFGAFGALTGHVTSVLGSGLLGFLILLRRIKPGRVLRFENFGADIKTMLRFSFPLYLGGLASTFSAQFVVIILAAVGTDASVGYYQAATNVTSAITLTSAAISQTLLPAFAHLEGTQSDTRLAFKYAVKYMGVVVAPIIFYLVGISGPIVSSLYGASFSQASLYLILLSLAEVPMVLGLALIPQFMNGVGATRLCLAYSLGSSLVQVVLAPVLAIGLGLGVLGVVYSVLGSTFAAVCLGLYLLRSYLEASVDLRSAALTVGCAIIPYAAFLLLAYLGISNLLVLIVYAFVFSGLYLTALPLSRALQMSDITRLRIAFEGLGVLGLLFRPILRYEERVLKL